MWANVCLLVWEAKGKGRELAYLAADTLEEVIGPPSVASTGLVARPSCRLRFFVTPDSTFGSNCQLYGTDLYEVILALPSGHGHDFWPGVTVDHANPTSFRLRRLGPSKSRPQLRISQPHFFQVLKVPGFTDQHALRLRELRRLLPSDCLK